MTRNSILAPSSSQTRDAVPQQARGVPLGLGDGQQPPDGAAHAGRRLLHHAVRMGTTRLVGLGNLTLFTVTQSGGGEKSDPSGELTAVNGEDRQNTYATGFPYVGEPPASQTIYNPE